MLLAGDLGGTKTLLGLFEHDAGRPRPVVTREFVTLAYEGLAEIVEAFLSGSGTPADRIDAAVIGVAGPVRGEEVALTNVPWQLDTRRLRERLGLRSMALLNDVEAMACSIPVLEPAEYVVLLEGEPQAAGNAALLSIGTGVGMALLLRAGERSAAVASEGGPADFAARTDAEIALVLALRAEHGRVEIERVASGPGVRHFARSTHGGRCPAFPASLSVHDEPAQITRAGLDGTCSRCREALDLYAEAIGAVAGNLALTAMASGGVYLGGGVPPKMLPALQSPRFSAAFLAKAPMRTVLERVPVRAITLKAAGLLGAAVRAGERAAGIAP